MKKFRSVMMLLAVLLGLTGAFAFSTPKSPLAGTQVGGTITMNADGSITISNPVNVTGLGKGIDYDCDQSVDVVCTAITNETLPSPLPSTLTLNAGDWTAVDFGAFEQ
jgi:hypothetical protein